MPNWTNALKAGLLYALMVAFVSGLLSTVYGLVGVLETITSFGLAGLTIGSIVTFTIFTYVIQLIGSMNNPVGKFFRVR